MHLHLPGAGAAAHADILDRTADPGVFMALEMGQRDDDIRIHQRPADLGLFNIVAPLDGNGNLIVALQAVGDQDMAACGILRKAVLVSGFDML